MPKFLKVILFASLLLSLAFAITAAMPVNSETPDNYDYGDINQDSGQNFKIRENKAIYRGYNNNVEDMYVTVVSNTKWTLDDINGWRFDRALMNQERPSVEVRFDSRQPSYSTLGLNANALLSPRGHGAGMAAQKSFKITLSDGAGLWNNQKVINLNKHPTDITRIRNKLSFDYINQIPELFGFRLQFCHLYIRDLTGVNKNFMDYGLFTHVEQPNKTYLKSHGIAQDAYMYKAQYFEFQRYEDIIKNTGDPGYNREGFEQILSIEGPEDHTRLISMLDDVNNMSLSINEVIDKDFDRENYIAWLAVNILMGNHDTNSQNFILMSPVTSSKWYFIPWDYDSAWGFETQPGMSNEYGPWEREGISNYWGVVLHRRFFIEPGNLQELGKKIDELAVMMNSSNTKDMLEKYYEATSSFIKNMPDIQFMPSTLSDYEKEYEKLPSIIEENRNKYYENIQKPMPVFLGQPYIEGGMYIFNWDESYDFQGDDLHYDFKISTDPGFTNIVLEQKNIKETTCKTSIPSKGCYYYKVDIYDSNGNHQIPFDYYTDPSGTKYYGIMEFTVY